MSSENVFDPSAPQVPTFSGVMVRSADSGEWMDTDYVPRGGNRLF